MLCLTWTAPFRLKICWKTWLGPLSVGATSRDNTTAIEWTVEAAATKQTRRILRICRWSTYGAEGPSLGLPGGRSPRVCLSYSGTMCCPFINHVISESRIQSRGPVKFRKLSTKSAMQWKSSVQPGTISRHCSKLLPTVRSSHGARPFAVNWLLVKQCKDVVL